MASSFRKMVHIKVLHNSRPIGEVKKPFRKTTRVTISNYRTRASNLLKKEKGKWFTVGAHYSPMHSGSGVKFD